MKETESCEYCDTKPYVGSLFEFHTHIDGGDQNLEMYLMQPPIGDDFELIFNGDCVEISVLVKFCPICGRKLK
jgi:hypothetical protein